MIYLVHFDRCVLKEIQTVDDRLAEAFNFVRKRILVFGIEGKNIGGIETFLLNMNEAMDSHCIFDYVVQGNVCIHQKRIEDRGGEILFVPNRKTNTIANYKAIHKIMKNGKDKYSAVYFNLSSLSWILPEMQAKHYGYRVIIHSHNAELIDKNSSFSYRLMNKMNKAIINGWDITRLACSAYAADFMFKKGTQYTVIKNAIDVNKYAFNEKLRNKWRENFKVGNELLFGFTGRFSYQKNPVFAVEIFGELKKKYPKSKFVMVGDGNLRSEVESRAKELGLVDDIILTGNILYANEIYNAMDFFVFPSRHEGLGIVLIEAQSNGLAGITSKGVVPAEAFITDLIAKEDINLSAQAWANRTVEHMENMKNVDRATYAAHIQEAGYNIEVEAKKLQNIIFTEE